MLQKRLLFILFLLVQTVWAQDPYVSINHESVSILEKLETKTGRLSDSFHSSIKPFSRAEVADYIKSINSVEYYRLTPNDRKNIDFIKTDNWEYFKEDSVGLTSKRPLLKYLFREKKDFMHYEHKDFTIHASPILYLSTGSNSPYRNYDNTHPFDNTRGVEISAKINHKLGFYTMLSDNIKLPANYQVDYFDQYYAFPYESFIKIKNDDSTRLQLNYFQAIGYFTFKPIKNLNLTFGHDKAFIGNGFRSLILSDFSAPFLQLKLDLRLGKFRYKNIFGQMNNLQIESPPHLQETHTPKFMTFHHLNANILPNLNVGVFESIMFGNRKIGFDPNYMNPIIFLRFVEGFLGSSDNAMVGADFKWNLFKAVSLYGQFVLDEFNKKEFKEDHWWGKKYGYQLGAKYYDFLGIDDLDIKVEHNFARPYLYSHFTTYTNFVNYNLPVAHPLGANFKENIVTLNYQPYSKLELSLIGMTALKGEDPDSLNYGGDILKLNIFDRPKDYGVLQGQGIENRINFMEFRASYMLWHNVYADAAYRIRKDRHVKTQNEHSGSVGIRWNFPYRNYIF